MAIWRSEISTTLLNERGRGTLADFLDIEFIEFGEDYLKATMPVTDKVKQPLGIMNGGVSCVIAETVGSTAANYAVDNRLQYCVGLEINTNHLRPAKSGVLTACARPFHLGKTTQVWSIEISNEVGKLISVSRHTVSVQNR
ncbi:MAG: hotdog fold thioesterase [Francisellaceae bacterium]